jgi:hypothetical protein
MDLVLPLKGIGTLIFAADGIEKDIIGLFCERKKAQLGIIEKAIDKMELDQRFLTKKLGAIKQYLMVLDIIDVFYLERRHADLPDDPAGSSPELNIMRRDQGLGQIGLVLLLQQNLVGKIKIILVDKAPIETLSLLVERTIAIVRKNSVWVALYHWELRY